MWAVMLKLVGLASTQSSSGGKGSWDPWAASAPSTTLCLSPLLHKLFPAHYSRRNWKLPWWKLHHTAVFACSLLQHWLSTTKRGGKKTPNPTKICFQHFFCNPFNRQTSSWSSSSSSPTCFSLLFQQGKVYGLKKKKITCCKHVVGQVANNLLEHGSHHKISFYIVCRGPKFATTLLMATNKCTAV